MSYRCTGRSDSGVGSAVTANTASWPSVMAAAATRMRIVGYVVQRAGVVVHNPHRRLVPRRSRYLVPEPGAQRRRDGAVRLLGVVIRRLERWYVRLVPLRIPTRRTPDPAPKSPSVLTDTGTWRSSVRIRLARSRYTTPSPSRMVAFTGSMRISGEASGGGRQRLAQSPCFDGTSHSDSSTRWPSTQLRPWLEKARR